MAELTLTDTRPAAVPRATASPAAHLAAAFAAAEVTGPRGVALREVPFLTMVGLRVAPGSGPAGRVAARLGTQLPTRCGSTGGSGDDSVLWLAPDELLVMSGRDAADLTAELVAALHGEPGSALDLSANRTTLELSGPSARDLLEKGCPLDLHPRSFAVAEAYATTLAGVPVLLWKTAAETYRVLPRSSFADHVGRWLVDAMLEYGAADTGAAGPT